MFSCACSLRSTQCAALIALATAAGIARVDGAHPALSGKSIRGLGRAGRAEVATHWEATERWFHFFQAIFAKIAPASPRGGESCRLAAATNPPWSDGFEENPVSPLHRLAGTASLPLADEAPRIQNRSHWFPFALGPPLPGIASFLTRTDGPEVPGDSAARLSLESGIVVLMGCFFARCALPRGMELKSAALRSGPTAAPSVGPEAIINSRVRAVVAPAVCGPCR